MSRLGNWFRYLTGGGTVMTRQIWDAGYRRGDWDFLADSEQATRHIALASLLVKRLAHVPTFSLVEIGCGDGAFLHHLPANCSSYLGVDLSSKALARASASNAQSHIHFLEGDANSWLPVQAPDAVLCNESIYYLKDPVAQMCRYQAMLAPQGILVVSLWDSPRNRPILSRIHKAFPSCRLPPVEAKPGLRWELFCVPFSRLP